MSRMSALLAVIAAVAFVPLHADAATLSLVGASTKICQLTGETDWATNQPTAAQTLSHFGLDAVDLGFPVDSGTGPLFFLFGDAIPNGHPLGSIPSVPPDDALGWTTRTAPPDSSTCLDLQLATKAPQKFAHPTVFPPILQGSFNVPSGGIFFDNIFYAFFWTNHCVLPGVLTPDPGAPLSLPPPNATCAETAAINSVGRSVLAAASPANPVLFRQTAPTEPFLLQNPLRHMPSGFVYVSAAQTAPEIAVEPIRRRPPGIAVFGAARYRASIPYLAIAPRETFGDPATWSFFAGRVAGNPVWITRAQWESGRNAHGEWAPPPGAEIYDASPAGERCVGEHSVTWNAPLHTWLLLYNCAPWTVEARFAPKPWGPWSPPTTVLSAAQNPAVICTLIMSVAGCPGLARRNYWTLPNGNPWPGIFYAPFVMNRFTRDATPQGAATRSATIYWLLSTWNPYAVVVMQSTLALAP